MPSKKLDILSRSVCSAVQCLWADGYGMPPVAILLTCAAGVLAQVPWVLHQWPVAYIARPHSTPAQSHLTETCAACWRLLHGASPNSMGCLILWGPLEEQSWLSWGCIGLSTAPYWAGSSPLLLTGAEACAAEIRYIWGMGLCHWHGIECRWILSLADQFCTFWMRRSVRFPPYMRWMHAVMLHVPPGNCHGWWNRLWCVVPHPAHGWCLPWLYRPGTGHRNSVSYISHSTTCAVECHQVRTGTCIQNTTEMNWTELWWRTGGRGPSVRGVHRRNIPSAKLPSPTAFCKGSFHLFAHSPTPARVLLSRGLIKAINPLFLTDFEATFDKLLLIRTDKW